MSNNNYSFKVKVTKDDLDNLDHVNNVQYLKWVQEAAERHWKVLSSSHLNEKYVWVVLRHEIDYFQAAKLQDELEVTTWIGATYGVKSERFSEIKIRKGTCVKAKTIWCLLDKMSMKPVRIPQEIIQFLESAIK